MTPYKLLGIGSWDRSGSTIIANVLGGVRGVVAVGEVNNLWQRGVREDRVCGCGDRFSECHFWKPIMDVAFGSPKHHKLLDATVAAHDELGNRELLRHRLTGRWSGPADAYTAGLERLYDAIYEVTGAELIVDPAKKPWHIALSGRVGGAHAYVLHLVRDPRGVAYSHLKKVSYDDETQLPVDLRRGTTFTALGWRYRNLIFSHYWNGSPNYRLLRYEDFGQNPRETTRQVVEWLGLGQPDLPFQGPQEVLLGTNHNVAGNPVRFRSGSTRLTVDQEWRNELAKGRHMWVDTLTWPMSKRYGY